MIIRQYLGKYLPTFKNRQRKIIYSQLKVDFSQIKSDDKLWSSESEFDQRWKERISGMAFYIDIPGSVVDFGCGLMWLETLLKPENSYIPIDYIQRDPRTIVIDLNKAPIPELKAEIAFLSGVLEYVKDLDKFINNLTQRNFKKIIISYCPIEKWSDLTQRESFNWVSHESIFKLLSLFTAKYALTVIDEVNSNTILVFQKKNE